MNHEANGDLNRRNSSDEAAERQRSALDALYRARSEIDEAIRRFSGIPTEPEGGRRAPDAVDVLAVIEARKRRETVISPSLFSDPAWDILLDLFHSHLSGRRLSVSAVCIGSRAPSATALRYLSQLSEAGFAHRIRNRDDGRRAHVALTDTGVSAMTELFQTAAHVTPIL